MRCTGVVFSDAELDDTTANAASLPTLIGGSRTDRFF